MKVALLSFEFGEYCIRLASALGKRAEVMLLLPEREAAPYLSLLGDAVRFQPFSMPRLRQPLRQVGMIYSIHRWISEFDPDVTHLQQGHMWFNLALPLMRQEGLVLTIHDPRYHVGDGESQRVPQRIANAAFYRASRVIVHANRLKQLVVDDLGLDSAIVHVIPHIALGHMSGQTSVEEEDHLILFFGRIWGYKGLEYLIRAEPLVTAKVADARIVIAGRGEDFTRYERMMLHPEHFIVYNEYVSDEKRAELFKRASVVVMPYIDASQSGVISLAYAFSKPVVATTVGGLPELVEDGQTGYLVPPRDEVALAEAMVRLLRDRTLRRRLGSQGKRRLDTECSAEEVALKTLIVYQCAIDGE